MIKARSSKRPDGVGCGYNSPDAVIPQRGKVAKDSHSAAKSERWRVFHEDDGGANVANDSGLFAPKSTFFMVQPGAVAGGADALAGEAAGNDINGSAPWESVKGADVVPDGEGREDSVALALEERAAAIVIKLDSTDGGMSE